MHVNIFTPNNLQFCPRKYRKLLGVFAPILPHIVCHSQTTSSDVVYPDNRQPTGAGWLLGFMPCQQERSTDRDTPCSTLLTLASILITDWRYSNNNLQQINDNLCSTLPTKLFLSLNRLTGDLYLHDDYNNNFQQFVYSTVIATFFNWFSRHLKVRTDILYRWQQTGYTKENGLCDLSQVKLAYLYI